MSALAPPLVEGDAGHLHRHGEEDQHDEIGEHDHRQHGVAQTAACPRVGNHSGRHRRRKRDDHHDEQGQHAQPFKPEASGAIGSQDHASHPVNRSPVMATASVTRVIRTIARKPERRAVQSST